MDQVDSWDYSKMEYQANMFAGMVLVPPEFLGVEFMEQLRLFEPKIEQIRSNGIRRDAYAPTVLVGIAYILSPKFKVSAEVLRIRIKNDCLEQEIQ